MNLRRPVRGIAMIEVSIAFLVMSLALIPIIGLFSSARRQARQTADFGLALTLQQKVSDDLRLANWEDAHLVDRLAADPAYRTGAAHGIVDDGTPFFVALEDLAKPLGRLTRGEDPGLSPRFEALYRQAQSFSLKHVAAPRSLPTSGAVLDVELAMQWRDPDGSHETIPLTLVLGAYALPSEVPDCLDDREAADERIRELLFGDRALGIQQVAAESGEPEAVLRALGEVLLVVDDMATARANYDDKLAQLRKELADATRPVERCKLELALGRTYESQAAVLMRALHYIVRPVAELDRAYAGTLAASPAPNPRRDLYLEAVPEIEDLMVDFEGSLKSARRHYSTALREPLARVMEPRTKTRVLMKRVELVKLSIAAAGSNDLRLLKELLALIQDLQHGRNNNFFDFAQFEKEHSRTAAEVKEKLVSASRWEPLAQLGTKFSAVAAKSDAAEDEASDADEKAGPSAEDGDDEREPAARRRPRFRGRGRRFGRPLDQRRR